MVDVATDASIWESSSKEIKEVTNVGNSDPVLQRVYMFLEDGDFKSADRYFERVLDWNPQNAMVYLGKVMVEQRVCRMEKLVNCKKPFDKSKSYQRVLQFGDENLATTLKGDVYQINRRNEYERKVAIFDDAKKAMRRANNEAFYRLAASKYQNVKGVKNADLLAKECQERAEAYQLYRELKHWRQGLIREVTFKYRKI